ncbi:MAG TPA: outer membrane lipoprotein-sorting protein [Thermoanaerobaculia bacterium]|nr:outer membrane lipoprotein-sorting protein [Thermoanaerobaculia bacterium]
MIRKTFACLLLAGLAGAASFAPPAQAQTLDELIQKHVQAVGGKEKLDAVQGVRMTGRMSMMQGMEAPFVLEIQDPNKMRMDITIQGMTLIQAYDGKTGWRVVPFGGNTDAEDMSAEELKQMERQTSNFVDLLTDYKARGYEAELVGKEDVEGSPAYKIKLTAKDGETVQVFLDAEQYLPIKMLARVKAQGGQEVEVESALGDYKEVGGVLFAHSIQSKSAMMPGTATMTIEKIEVNPELAAARFEKPAKKAEPAKEAPKDAPKPPQG